MPRINFSNVGLPSSGTQFLPLPPGQYRVRCKQCDAAYNQDGIEAWKLKLEVLEPQEHFGRLVWDNLSWGSAKGDKASGHALARCKLVCSRLGGIKVDMDGEIDVVPADLEGKTCLVELELEQRDYKTGQVLPPEKQRNRVTFSGYDVDPNALNGEPTPF